MTPQALKELITILDSYKADEITQEQACIRLQEVFKREPVNYKRRYIDPAISDEAHESAR